MRSDSRPTSLLRPDRAKLIIAACLVAAGAGIAMPLIGRGPVGRPATTAAAEASNDAPAVGDLTKGTPEFDTVLPAGKSIEDFGGWTRVSPPKRDPVFAFVDRIGGIPINVSEQRLPTDFKDDPDDQLRDLALAFGASKSIDAAGTIVYIGTSAKGPQSVIFRKGDLLVLIKASAAVPDDEWKKYIKSLG